jgi:hypothetical protein
MFFRRPPNDWLDQSRLPQSPTAPCPQAPVDISAVVMDEGPGRQARWQELTKSECFELLACEHLGRVAVVDDRGPVVFPVNFVL